MGKSEAPKVRFCKRCSARIPENSTVCVICRQPVDDISSQINLSKNENYFDTKGSDE